MDAMDDVVDYAGCDGGPKFKLARRDLEVPFDLAGDFRPGAPAPVPSTSTPSTSPALPQPALQAGNSSSSSSAPATPVISALAAANGCVLAAFRGGGLLRWYPEEREAVWIDCPKEPPTTTAAASASQPVSAPSGGAGSLEVRRIFIDPKGFHALLGGAGDEVLHLSFDAQRARHLPRVRGQSLEAVCWDSESTPASTKDLLLGTRQGQFLHVVIEGKVLSVRLIHTFRRSERPVPVSGVHRERTSSKADGTERTVLFVAAACKLYAFLGSFLETAVPKTLNDDAVERALVYEVPLESPHPGPHLHIGSACTGLATARALFWLTGVGVLAAFLNFPVETDGSVLEAPPGLIPFPQLPTSGDDPRCGSLIESLLPPPPEAPHAMALTRYHIVFLFRDRWAVVSRITHEVVQQHVWSQPPPPTGPAGLGLFRLAASVSGPRGLAEDVQGRQLWLHAEGGDGGLYELVVDQEDRDAWSLLAGLGQFKDAIAACDPAQPWQRAQVLALQAERLLQEGLVVQAALKFAEATSVPFENVALRLQALGREDALLAYVRARLKRLSRDDTDKVPRCLLAVIGLELAVAQLHEVGNDDGPGGTSTAGTFLAGSSFVGAGAGTFGGSRGTRGRVSSGSAGAGGAAAVSGGYVGVGAPATQSQWTVGATARRPEVLPAAAAQAILHEILEECCGISDVHTVVYHILQSHGRFNELARFAEMRRDFSTVILHHICRREYAIAIHKLAAFHGDPGAEELLCNYGPMLHAAEPKAFVSLLLRPQLAHMSPSMLLPAVFSPRSSAAHRRDSVRFLSHAVQSLSEPALNLTGTNVWHSTNAAAARDLEGGAQIASGDGATGEGRSPGVTRCPAGAAAPATAAVAGGAATPADPVAGSAAFAGGGSRAVAASTAAQGWASNTGVFNALVVLLSAPGPGDGKADAVGDAGSDGQQAALLKFLESVDGNPLLDAPFALRVCAERGLAKAVAQLYSHMGLYREAVDTALQAVDLTLAKRHASRPADAAQRHLLWMHLAQRLAHAQAAVPGEGDLGAVAARPNPLLDAQGLAELVRESEDLSMLDVLPHLDPSTKLEHLQPAIDWNLAAYKEDISSSWHDICKLRDDLLAFKSQEGQRGGVAREIAVCQSQLCELCSVPVAEERFYAFPCGHCFHEACLRALFTASSTLQPEIRDRLFALEALRLEHQAAAAGALIGGKEPSVPLEEVEEQLDDILAEDCALCGDMMVKVIRRPFVDPHETDLQLSWAI